MAAVVLTLGRRWSRGRLGGEMCVVEVVVHAGGRRLVPCWCTSSTPGAARCTLAVKMFLSPVPVLGSSLTRRDAAAARPSLPQRRGAAVARPPSPSVLTALRWKKKPQVGAVGFASRPHRLSPFEMASRRLEGESPSVPLAPPPSGAGGAPRPRPGAPWMPAGGANPSFPFSPRAHPVASACTGPWRACRPGGVHTSVTERERESGGAG
jgi:hypothetical protein